MTLNALNEWLDSVRRTLAQGQTPRNGSDAARLLDELPLAVFRADSEGVCTFLSARWTELSGYSTQDAVGMKVSHYVHPKDRQQCEDYLRGARTGEIDTEPLLVRLICRGGDSRWFEIRADAQGGDHGMAGTLSSVGAWVRDARGLESRHQALATLVDDLPGMAYRCRMRRDWSMEYVSGGCLELTGYHPQNIVHGAIIEYGELIHREDRERVWNEVHIAVRENRYFELMYRIVTRGGNEKWAWERGKAVCTSTGEVLALEGFITDVTRIKKEEERLRRGTLFDSVTGLPATPLFMEHVQHALEETRVDQHAQFALLLVHLHHLAPALAGVLPAVRDSAVRDIYRRIRSRLEAADIVCRLDNDRYGVLLEDASNLAELARVSRRLQEQFLSPIRADGSDIYVSSSIGIALSSSRYARADQMLRDADIALNRGRNLGGGKSEIFDLHAHARASALSRLEQEIRSAIEKERFVIYWEPIFTAMSNRIAAIEARLAWEHPQRGLLLSEDYLPMAEEVQLVQELWEHMFAKACVQLESWKPNIVNSGIAVNVQISGRSLLDADAILRLGEHLLEVKPDSFNLALGIPEVILSEDSEAVHGIADRLKDRNVRLVLDDFGAGPSSLAVLRDLPIDYIRLDKPLITENERDARFTAALVKLAHTLGIQVVAGYIESEEQRQTMLDAGVDFLQGGSISAPLNAEDVLALLSASSAAPLVPDGSGTPK